MEVQAFPDESSQLIDGFLALGHEPGSALEDVPKTRPHLELHVHLPFLGPLSEALGIVEENFVITDVDPHGR